MKPEERARWHIDHLLDAAGWHVQDYQQLNLGASPGVAVREYPLNAGPADYLLFVDRKAVGVIEAKPEGTTLGGVDVQSQKYLTDLPATLPRVCEPLSLAYESTGVETFFRDLRDLEPRSRRVFAFHKPEIVREWLSQPDTLRTRLTALPPLIQQGLRDCQIEAITGLDHSFAEARPRALIQMASGAGKTYTAVSFIYRLIKFAGAKRVLFLVDRNNLARQTLREFQGYVTPDDHRRFTDLYDVQHLRSNTIDPVSKVCITTIQRLYSLLKGEATFDEANEEMSLFDQPPLDEPPKEVVYTPRIPIETFDFIVTDECHRSIYYLWRQVLEYFDAFIVGLTATPHKQTLGFFNQNLVTEYGRERAVADGVNVDYDVYRIKTQITEQGSRVDAGYYVDRRDRLTRRVRWERLDEDLTYSQAQLDRDVVASDQIRTVIKTFRDKLFTEIFPGRTEVPKTLIFAKDDSHADDILWIVREEFGRGNDFCKKITYRTTGEKTDDLIANFRNSYNPRIAVTVDMISTGTDVKPLECLIFMRDVKSTAYFEQMKGRGTRTISDTDLQAVTPDAQHKTHFVIVDAVGVCETDKTDSRPLERKRSVPFDSLLTAVARGNREPDVLSSLASRLARLDREIDPYAQAEIQQVTGGTTLQALVNKLLDALDPDVQRDTARWVYQTDAPTDEQVTHAAATLAADACAPFDDADLRNKLSEIRRRSEQTIDQVSRDTVLFAGYDDGARETPQALVGRFKEFIEDNQDEITALQILYNQPYARRHLTYEEVKQLAEAIQKPPYFLTTDRLWQAYEQLEKSKVRRAGPDRLLTNLISLVRFATGQAEVLEPYAEAVNQRFERWLQHQERTGTRYTPEQKEWLVMIKDHIVGSVSVGIEDFDLTPFFERGGIVRAHSLFGSALNHLLAELNEALVA